MNKKKPKKKGIALPYFNRRVRYEHTILSKLEVGVVLKGPDVRALLIGKFDVTKSYVDFSSRKPIELFWKNANIDNVVVERKLLLHYKEISRLFLNKSQKKAVIVVQKIYLRNYKIKLEIVLAKRKKKHEKRGKILAKEYSKELKFTKKLF